MESEQAVVWDGQLQGVAESAAACSGGVGAANTHWFLTAAKAHICPENLSLRRETPAALKTSRSKTWPPRLFIRCSKRDREGNRALRIRISYRVPRPSWQCPTLPIASTSSQAPPGRASPPLATRPPRSWQAGRALCRERFKTIFLSPSPGSAGVRRSIWQEKSSLLILASGSPPRQRQLNRYGKLGSTEVRAGRCCLPTAHTLPDKYKPAAGRGEPRWLGLKQILPSSPRGGARTNCRSRGDLLPDPAALAGLAFCSEG